MQKKWYITFITLLVVGIGIGISYVQFWRDAGIQLPEDVTMKTAYGEEFNFAEMEPKVRLVEFMYTACPDVCPLTTQRMMHLKKQFQNQGVYGSEVEFLTITIDPEQDTQEALQKYAATFGAEKDEAWNFVRGSISDTRKVADPFRFLFKDNGTDYLVHTSFAYLIDEKNYLVAKFPMGDAFDKEQVYAQVMGLVK